MRKAIGKHELTNCSEFEISASPATYLRFRLGVAFASFIAALLFGVLCTLADSKRRLGCVGLSSNVTAILDHCFDPLELGVDGLRGLIALYGNVSLGALIFGLERQRWGLLRHLFVFLVTRGIRHDLCLCQSIRHRGFGQDVRSCGLLFVYDHFFVLFLLFRRRNDGVLLGSGCYRGVGLVYRRTSVHPFLILLVLTVLVKTSLASAIAQFSLHQLIHNWSEVHKSR